MNRVPFYLVLCVGLVAFLCCGDAFADAIDTAQLETEAGHIKNFLFGAPMKIAGIIGGGWGVISSIITSSIRPLIVYGGIGLAANLVPKFIDAVF